MCMQQTGLQKQCRLELLPEFDLRHIGYIITHPRKNRALEFLTSHNACGQSAIDRLWTVVEECMLEFSPMFL